MKWILSLVFFSMVYAAAAQSGPDLLKKIPAGEVKQDLNVLKDTLQKIHPGLYRYTSKESFDRMFDSCYSSVTDSMSLPGLYTMTKYIVACIKDGHSNVKLPADGEKKYYNTTVLFPALLMFIHSRAFIACCRQNNDLAGSELLSIDDHPMPAIIQRMFTLVPSDAGITSRKNWELPENFYLFYNVLYGKKKEYDIQVRTQHGEIRAAKLKADSIGNIICAQLFPRPAKYLDLHFTDNNIAVLTLKTFFNGFLDNSKENFSQFLDSSFAVIKERKITRLIIDVRSNQGGNDDNGEMLYSWLTQKPFRYYAAKETVTMTLDSNNESMLKVQQPRKNNYKGKLWVLINGRSFSGVAEFSSMVRANNRGLFIGEECGGGFFGNTSGNENMVSLPNSQIIIRIPLVKYTMAVSNSSYHKNGIIPDFPFYPTISDITSKNDTGLQYAIKIASAK